VNSLSFKLVQPDKEVPEVRVNLLHVAKETAWGNDVIATDILEIVYQGSVGIEKGVKREYSGTYFSVLEAACQRGRREETVGPTPGIQVE